MKMPNCLATCPEPQRWGLSGAIQIQKLDFIEALTHHQVHGSDLYRFIRDPDINEVAKGLIYHVVSVEEWTQDINQQLTEEEKQKCQ